MASDPITGLPPAAALTGSDPLVTVQGGVTVQSDVDAMKAFMDASQIMQFKGQADASAIDEDAATGTSIFQAGDVYRINVAASAPHAFSDISEDLNIGDWAVFNGTIFEKQDGTDPTAVETKTAYESNADTNAFTDFEQTKLDDINDRGFNIQTAFFDGNSFSTASEDITVNGFAYNLDGTRLWTCGGATDTIYEYDLAIPYRPSSAVYNGVSLSVAAQEVSVSGIAITPDGLKFIICGTSGDELNQYSFGSAFSLTGASFDSVTISVSAQTTVPKGVQYNKDGSKLFIIGGTPGIIFQYTVNTPFDLSGGISFDNVTLDVSNEDNNPNGFSFKDGGYKLYITGPSSKVFQYDLPTPYILTNGKFDNISFDVSSQDTNPVEVVINPNGSIMSIHGNIANSFFEYELDSDGIFTDAEKLKLADMAYAERTASAKQTITGGGALVLAHNLSGTPTLWYVILENKEAEHNFSPGDQTRPSAVQSSSNDQGVGIIPDGSDLNIRYGSGFGGGSSVFSVVDQITGDVEIATNSKWESIFVAVL